MPHPPNTVPDQPTEREIFPDHYTFSQRYGYEPLPEPMQLERLPDSLRWDVWDTINDEFLKPLTCGNTSLGFAYMTPFAPGKFNERKDVIKYILARIKKLPKTDVKEDSREEDISLLRFIVIDKDFNQVLDFLEITFYELEDSPMGRNLADRIKELFETHCSAYRLDTSQHPYWFSPCVSQEQGDAIREGMTILHQREMNNAIAHFRNASKHIQNQKYGDSVAESFKAVESVVCEIAKPKKTLGQGLSYLEGKGFFQGNPHRLLKEALEKLGAYAHDSVRHGKSEGNNVEVGLDEAMLMYGAYASFAAYLTRKHQG